MVAVRARFQGEMEGCVTYNWTTLFARCRAVGEIKRSHPAEKCGDHDQRANTCEHRGREKPRGVVGFPGWVSEKGVYLSANSYWNLVAAEKQRCEWACDSRTTLDANSSETALSLLIRSE